MTLEANLVETLEETSVGTSEVISEPVSPQSVGDTSYLIGAECSDIGVFDRLLKVAGKSVVDVGCGTGEFAELLAERGGRVLGVEPTLGEDRSVPVAGTGTLHFGPGTAEALPVADQATDIVVFKYSLHHVPVASMPAALTEALRILKPEGYLYVAEPIPEGSFHEVVCSFHDESTVQRAAERALSRTVASRFRVAKTVLYITATRYEDFTEFVADMTSKAYNDYPPAAVESDTVRRAFDACRIDGHYVLRQPIRVNLYAYPQRP
jgi:ubiquinone/menaquinone biosynthesis C-methylase UbiE